MPITGGGGSQYITDGTSGITTIRFEDSTGALWDLTINQYGAVVTTAVVVGGTPTTSNPYGPGWFLYLTYV